jgi:hypothetical protein
MLSLALAWLLAAAPAIDNSYVRVTRNEALCAAAGTPGCGASVIVALEALEVEAGHTLHRLARGDVAVFGPHDSFSVSAQRQFFEVAIRPDHPPALAPAESIAPEKNAMRHDGDDFIVFEEKLEPGDTRARHSHSQRVVIQLNPTTLQQWPDGAAEIRVEVIPEKPTFSPPVVHKVRNVGEQPLFGIIVEFKPRPTP